MKSPFLHMIDPASVRAAAERLQTTAPATRQGGRHARDIIAPERDPEIDDILSEIEARQADGGDFDTFLERIGVGSAEATHESTPSAEAARSTDAASPGNAPGTASADPLLEAALEEGDESSAAAGSADGDIQNDDSIAELDDLEDVQDLVDGRELEEGDPTE